jgi:RNA polymerase sigma-70 factor (ECF subfamily)
MEQNGPAQCLTGRTEIEDDVSLIRRFRDGQEEAFDGLVRKHQQRVFNIAFQILRNYEDANEMAQDTFVKVYQHLADFRGESAFTTWLYQIVTNLSRNRVRYNQRRHKNDSVSIDATREDEDGLPQIQLSDSAQTPDKATAVNEETLLIDTAMGKISEAHREVLVLRVTQGLSYEEIATVLACSLGTVKSRIARAREELLKTLKEMSD